MNSENMLSFQNNKRHILLVSCFGMGNGGIQNVLMQIVRGLSDKYIFDVLVFTNKEGYYEEEFKSYGGNVFRIPNYNGSSATLNRINFFFRGMKIYRESRKIIKVNGPYVAIHCNNYYESAFCLKAAYKEDVPIRISHAHGYFGDMSTPLRKSYLSFCRRTIDKYATNFIGCSKLALMELFNRNNGFVISNSINTEKFDYTKFARSESASPRFIQVGQYCDNKNQAFTIDVFRQLIVRYPDATLNLVGFGTYESQLRNRINEYKIEEKVTFTPGTADVAYNLSNSDIFLFPSKHEGLGIAAIEAQVMHLKCFASDTVPEEINVGLCEFLPLNLGAEAWSNRIVEYWENRNESSVDLNYERFMPEKIIKQYEDLYPKFPKNCN